MQDKDLVHLLEQESFLNYCFGRNDSDVRYWNNWVANHPDKEIQIEMLKRTVIMMAKASRETLRDKHFEELQQKISGAAVIPVTKKRSLWKPIWAAAAVVLIAAGIALIYSRPVKPEANNIIVQKTDVKPGRNKAILILGNGQKISLSDSSNGRIAVQSGAQITKTANGQIVYQESNEPATSDPAPEYNTIEAPAGGQWQVVLPDQSKVWLNARSSLTYPTSFTGNERKVQLKGEAYFEITHNEKMPFKVSSKSQVVEVLGTHFNIMAYEDEQIMRTTLLQGSVRISDGSQSRVLVPGEQAQISTAGMMKVTREIDLEDVMAWKNGYFKFNESLESSMRKIARWYDVKITYASNIDPSLRFGGKISRNKNLSSALKIMELTGNVHFKIKGRSVTVMQ